MKHEATILALLGDAALVFAALIAFGWLMSEDSTMFVAMLFWLFTSTVVALWL